MTSLQQALPVAQYYGHVSHQEFNFEKLSIRVITINGEPWFVASDVCSALEIDRTAVRRLDDDEKGMHLMHTPGGEQNIAIVSEPGLYTLILRCRDAIKPGTVPYKFRKWVTSDVLPSIRKNAGHLTHSNVGTAYMMASDVAAKVARSVFESILSGSEDPVFDRWIVSIGFHGAKGEIVPSAKKIDRDAFVFPTSKMISGIENGDIGAHFTNEELAGLAAGASNRLKSRLNHALAMRKRQTTKRGT